MQIYERKPILICCRCKERFPRERFITADGRQRRTCDECCKLAPAGHGEYVNRTSTAIEDDEAWRPRTPLANREAAAFRDLWRHEL